MLYLNWCWYLCVPLPSFPSADWQSPIVILHTISGVEPAPSTPLYNISFIWASLGGYGYSYPWYPPPPPPPPSLPPSFCLPQTPSYHGMQQRQSTDGLSWKLIRSSHLADLVQTTGGREGGREGESNMRNLMLRLIFHPQMREFIVSSRHLAALRRRPISSSILDKKYLLSKNPIQYLSSIGASKNWTYLNDSKTGAFSVSSSSQPSGRLSSRVNISLNKSRGKTRDSDRLHMFLLITPPPPPPSTSWQLLSALA